MRARSWLLLLPVTAVLASGAGCGAGGGRLGDPIRIGVVADCSTDLGRLNIEGAELPLLQRGASLKDSNPADGVSMATVAGRPVSLKIACAEPLMPGPALAQLSSLVEDRKVDAVVGPNAEGAPIVARYAKAHPGVAFMLADYDQSSTLQLAAPNVFRFELNAAQWSAGLAAYAYHRLGLRNVTTVGENVPPGWTQTAGFDAEFCALGGRIVQRLWPPYGTSHLGQWETRVSARADGVFLVLVSQADPSGFIRAWGLRHKLTRHLVGGWNAPNTPQLHNVVIASSAPFGPTPAYHRFESAFKKAFGRPDEAGSGQDYYDEVEPLLKALEEVHGKTSDNGQALQAALRRLHYASPYGPIHLDKRNQAVGNTYLSRIIGNGDYNQFKTVRNVEQTFGGYFTRHPAPPGPNSPACVKGKPPPWAVRQTR
jgi:branched-chain amino acid transport system substrate-binding protein